MQRKPGDRCSDFSRCFAHFALHSSLFASRGRESCCVGCATLRRRERYQVVRKPTGSVLHVLSHQRRPDDQELRWKDPRSTRRQRLAYRESPQTLCNHWLSGLPTKLSPFPDKPPRSRKQAKTSPVATSTVRSTWSKEYGRRRFNAACNPHHDMLFEYRISNLESEISNLESCSVSPHAHAISHHLSHRDGDSPASIIQSTCPSVMMYAQHRRKVVLSVGLVMMSPIILSVVVR